MKALLFNVNVPKFLIIQALRPIRRSFCYRDPFSTVKLVDMPEPALPSPEWVKLRTRLCGVCGIISELIVTTLKGLRMPHGKLIMDIGCITGDVERVNR